MPDIAMCANEECPLKKDCYRYMAEPNEYRQCYMDFKPEIKGKEVTCSYFYTIPQGYVTSINNNDSQSKKVMGFIASRCLGSKRRNPRAVR